MWSEGRHYREGSGKKGMQEGEKGGKRGTFFFFPLKTGKK
jgi:hypothetical protein